MPRISTLHAREVLDSRGNPTVEVDIRLAAGAAGSAIVPSGASTGTFEALELRDGDRRRFRGKGVRKAVARANGPIARALCGKAFASQAALDRALVALDGTSNKSRLGANAILGVSMAFARACASAAGVQLWEYVAGLVRTVSSPRSRVARPAPGQRTGDLGQRTGDLGRGTLDPGPSPVMPIPMINIISGGLHAGGTVDLQDFLLIPWGARSTMEALEMTHAVWHATRDLAARRHGYGQLVADEGGLAPVLRSNEEGIELLADGIRKAGLRAPRDAAIALDVASTHFFRAGRYRMARDRRERTADEMIALLARWVRDYPVVSIEDGLAEDDWDGWRALTRTLGNRIQLIGDDLFVTNTARLERGIAEGCANTVLVKLNQIGTVTETLETAALARLSGYAAVISARSGETEDAFLADFAVGSGAGQIKIGSITRSSRLAKYNQLLRIEEGAGLKLCARRRAFPCGEREVKTSRRP